MSNSSNKIQIVVVDDNVDTLANLKKLLYFEKDIEIVATASNGEEAIKVAEQYHPDVILMDINMPGMDGISASEAITTRVPGTQIVIMSVQAESDYLRRAMLAGAREFLIKPFSSEELATTLRRVYQLRPPKPAGDEAPPATKGRTSTIAAPASAPVSAPPPPAKPTYTPEPPREAPAPPPPPAAPRSNGKQGKILVFFSAKGGSGRSTLAANLAIALKDESKGRVALADCSLRFGDIGVLLNLNAQRTISDICSAEGGVDPDVLPDQLVAHASGIKVLMAPASPEFAELVKPEDVRTIMTALRNHFDYVVIDTTTALDEVTLSLLDVADQIFLVVTPEIPAIRNTKLFFEVAEKLSYAEDKMLLLINKADPKGGISAQAIQDAIKHPIFASIERDDRATLNAVQTGQPFVVNQKNAVISIAISKLARAIAHPQAETTARTPKAQPRRGLFG